MTNNDLPRVKTPFQQLNALLGEGEGLRRGQLVMCNSLPRNHSRGFLSDLTFGISLYNKPTMIDKSKTPMILRMTLRADFESEKLRTNARFKSMVEYGGPTMQEYMDQTDYTYRVFSPNTIPVTVEQLFGETKKLESQGFELHAVVIDDMDLIETGEEEDDLFYILGRIREFFEPRGTNVILHTLFNEEIKTLSHLSPEEFFNSTSRVTAYDKSRRRLDQMVDVQWILYLEPDGETANLHIRTAKSRSSVKPPKTSIIHTDDQGILIYDVDYPVSN